MADRFVPLREFLAVTSELQTGDVEAPVETPLEAPQPQAREAMGDVRRFRAAVRDAVDVTVRGVLCDVAAGVLARELALTPVNLQAIVARACERHAAQGIVRVRVHPDEAANVAEIAVDIVPDNSLRRGDALLEVRGGTIDVSLGARLADVLDAIAS